MGCLCFGSGKQDLSELSAPLDPAVPKPKPDVGNRAPTNSKNGRPFQNVANGGTPVRSGAAPNGQPATSSFLPVAVHARPQQQAPAATRPSQGSTSTSGSAAAAAAAAVEAAPPAAADSSRTRTNTGSRLQPLMIPDSPPGPPAHPKAANWDITPRQQPQQVDEADVDDIEVDLEEVQELSPIPTASATPATRTASPNGGPPFGPGRSGALHQGAGRTSVVTPTRSSTSATGEDDGVETFTGEAESPPPGSSPTALIYAQRQEQQAQSPFRETSIDDSDGQQQEQQKPVRLSLAQPQHSKESSASASSTSSSSDFDDDDDDHADGSATAVAAEFAADGDKEKESQQHESQKSKDAERQSQQRESHQDEVMVSEPQGIVTTSDAASPGAPGGTQALTSGGCLADSPPQQQQQQNESRSPRPQSARRTAPGPHAPIRPSPLGHGARHAPTRQRSNLSDDSDLSLPGEYERYGGYSSDDEMVADRQYEEAITAAGGQILPGATSRNSLAAGTRTSIIAPSEGAGGSAAEPAVSPSATPGGRKSGYENPMWREVLDEEDSPGLEGSPQSEEGHRRVPPLKLQLVRNDKDGATTADPEVTSPKGKRGVGSDFDSESESESESKSSESEPGSDDGSTVEDAARGRKLSVASVATAVTSEQRNFDRNGSAGLEAAGWDRGSDGDPGKSGLAEQTPPQRGSIRWTGSYTGHSGGPGGSLAASNSLQSTLTAVAPTSTATAPDAATTATVTETSEEMTVKSSATEAAEAAAGAAVATTAIGATSSRSALPRSPQGPLQKSPSFTASTTSIAAKPTTKSTPSGSKPVAGGAFKSSIPSAAKTWSSASAQSSTSTAAVEKAAAAVATTSATATAAATTSATATAAATTSATATAAATTSAAAAQRMSSLSSHSGLPHFMLPTRSSTVSLRRPSEEGVTPISGIPMTPATGSTAASTATSAAVVTSTTTAATPTPAMGSMSKAAALGVSVKAPSPAASGGVARPSAIGGASTARSAASRQSISMPASASKPPPPAAAPASGVAAAGPGSGVKTAAVSAAKPSSGSIPAATLKPSPGTAGTPVASKAAGAATASVVKPAPKSGAATTAGKPAAGNGASAAAKGGIGTATGTDNPTAAAGTKSESQLDSIANSAPAAAPAPHTTTPAGGGGGGGLPFGEWRMVRLKKDMRCCAVDGTVAQETHDGQMEVFKCEETLPPGALAAVISHSLFPQEVSGGAPQPKTWVFCPDPLCMESKPVGSDLPRWPAKIILAGGVKVTRAEYDHIKGLGLDVTLPGKVPAPAAAASG